MGWLLSLYIAITVFGVGVTGIDLLGLVGDQADEGDGGDNTDGETDFEADDGGDDFDAGANSGDDGFSADSDADGTETDSDGDDIDQHGSVAGHDRPQKRHAILRILSVLRNVVYFSLGFGPTGWFALGTGESVTAALLWSGGVGVVVLASARLLRQVVRSELSSEIQDSDLLMERGEVVITVNPNELGRVRITVGGMYVDRYARSKTDKAFTPGTSVKVTDVREDCVIIESEEE